MCYYFIFVLIINNVYIKAFVDTTIEDMNSSIMSWVNIKGIQVQIVRCINGKEIAPIYLTCHTIHQSKIYHSFHDLENALLEDQ